MPRRGLSPPYSLTARSVALAPGLFCGIDAYSGIMGGIPAARYHERVMGELHEATKAGDSKDLSLDLRPSVHRETSLVSSGPSITTHMSDVSRRGFFGMRPSDILN